METSPGITWKHLVLKAFFNSSLSLPSLIAVRKPSFSQPRPRAGSQSVRQSGLHASQVPRPTWGTWLSTTHHARMHWWTTYRGHHTPRSCHISEFSWNFIFGICRQWLNVASAFIAATMSTVANSHIKILCESDTKVRYKSQTQKSDTKVRYQIQLENKLDRLCASDLP